MSMMMAIWEALRPKSKIQLAYEAGRDDALESIRTDLPIMIKHSMKNLGQHLDKYYSEEKMGLDDRTHAVSFEIIIRKKRWEELIGAEVKDE